MKLPSGRFILRIPPALHLRLKQEAARRGASLNEACRQLLDAGLESGAQSEDSDLQPRDRAPSRWVSRLAAPAARLGVLGIVLFGSRARGEATAASDTDLLLVLPVGQRPSRELYAKWDEAVRALPRHDPTGGQLEPHFAALPAHAEGAGSLWFEIALDGVVLWDSSGELERRLRELRDHIAAGRAVRKFAHGQPYWIHLSEASRSK